MLETRHGTFTGGIDLPDDKDDTLDEDIQPIPHLNKLAVPLAPADAPPATLLFEPGQFVSHGEKLAAADSAGQADVFAPLAGKVQGLCEALVPAGRAGWRTSPAVILTDLDAPRGLDDLEPNFDYQAADDHSLRLRLAEGGLVSPDAVPQALGPWIEQACGTAAPGCASPPRAAGLHPQPRAAGPRANILIGNLMENTPFITADHAVLRDHGPSVVRGLSIIGRALGIKNIILAVDHRRVDEYRSAVGPARVMRIAAVSLAHKYPTGNPNMLAGVLTGREVPAGKGPLAVGAVVVDGAFCLAVYRWVACSQPATGRVLTVAGPRVSRPGNYYVPFGADAGELLTWAGLRQDKPCIHGSAMNGRILPAGAVIGPWTSALLALDLDEPAQPMQCIRCGWCVDHCPARLNVSGLNDDFELAHVERADHRGALACIDCGICSYLCPSRLPLAHRTAELKAAIRESS